MHRANGAATEVAVMTGGGRRSRLRNSGAATPVATSAHAPVRKARLDGRKMRGSYGRRETALGLADRARGGLAHEAVDHPRDLVGLGMPLDPEREALAGRLDRLGEVVELAPAG